MIWKIDIIKITKNSLKIILILIALLDIDDDYNYYILRLVVLYVTVHQSGFIFFY